MSRIFNALMELASSRKEPVILFCMGMNSYGKEFQYKELFLDLGILDLLKLRHTGIQFATLSFEVSFSEYPWCLNSAARGVICTPSR